MAEFCNTFSHYLNLINLARSDLSNTIGKSRNFSISNKAQ